ncbi:deoxynucleoside kinase [Saccharophagus degradans]|uniref:Deoxynucleoside kinase n=2 Tax=Saccharophagus degradans TaxID=86304 RepID=Q21F96_SACD2|nr:deoxynucleoside kinase [Saccharophagus degradans]ABD82633.1 deoxynucleoside kinase [Saccharophagus degradans 2-40]MBU2986328.1 deoxynucleoside kinase [Saccharophagus degradans]MDO6424371.1 deoxynucleoside kinase [Saccharophagus degradans]MDO6608422.1 deoxynucleoside kinase [Saccharophagus degradans]WGO99186.1 deoxynucleoside kinase [Saccharophagus degradans]
MSDAKAWQVDLSNQTLPRFIAVEGPIGVGKTTLAKQLAQTFNYDTLLERAEENPFLPRFYANEHNSALPTQLFFLFQRVQQINDLKQDDIFQPVRVADFLIDKDRLFAEVTLDEEAMRLYDQVYNHMTINAPKPDLVVYLQAPEDVLVERIKKRGIQNEQAISPEYLHQLNEAYTRFFHYYEDAPLLIVNAADIDWVNNPNDYTHLVEYMLSIKNGRHYYNPQPIIPGVE